MKVKNICSIGAGFVAGSTIVVIALKYPSLSALASFKYYKVTL